MDIAKRSFLIFRNLCVSSTYIFKALAKKKRFRFNEGKGDSSSKNMQVEITSGTIYFEKKGNGEPLILLHGNGEDCTIFDEAMEKLSSFFTVYAFDSPGHGKSMKVEEYHYSLLAERLYEAFSVLKILPAKIYGFSDGAIVALLIALRHPQDVETLLCSGINLSPRELKLSWRTLFYFSNLFSKNPLVKMMLKEPHIPYENLATLPPSTIFLFGERDLISKKDIRAMKKACPQGNFYLVKKENHGSYIVHQQKIADILLFLLKKEASCNYDLLRL